MPGSQVLAVARSILNFSYYTQLQSHTPKSLKGLHAALAGFHANKDVLVELVIWDHFNIPKLHQLPHYVQSISLFGAADGFNSELPECLHIDFAKDSYHASNKQDYKEQMVLWLQRQEAVLLCSAYLDWLSQEPAAQMESDSDLDLNSDMSSEETEAAIACATPAAHFGVTHVLAKIPAHPHQSVHNIVHAHGTTDFLTALQTFICSNLLHSTLVPGIQDCFDIYHQVVIMTLPDSRVGEAPTCRRIQVTPEKLPLGQKPGAPA
jgi:hypothetical protein